MLRTLDELEPILKDQYKDYQLGIANGSIQPPKRRKTEEERRERDRRNQDKAQNVTMPRTPTSVEDHTSNSRSTKPTPGVTEMLTEAQQQERDRQQQLERDRARGFLSSDDDRNRRSNRSQGSAPGPETAMPTPVPTPDRRTETNTFSQLPPPATSSSSIIERRRAEADADRSRNTTSRIQDDELKRAMGRLQDQFEARLQIVLNDPKPMDETERLQRALDVVADTGQAERDWIEEKNRLALQERRPSTFDKELNDQSALQEARMKQVRSLIKERVDRQYRQQADARAQSDSESKAREARLREEQKETLRKKVEADAARDRYLADAKERQRVDQQRARDDLLRAERERSKGSDGERNSEREREREREPYDRVLNATQAAMAHVSLGSQQRAEAQTSSAARRTEQQSHRSEGPPVTTIRGQ